MSKTEKTEHPFKTVRRAGVPLVAYETADPAATINGCLKALNGKPAPILAWDCMRGLRAVNEPAIKVREAIGEKIDTQNLAQCLDLIDEKYPAYLKDAEGDDKTPAVFFLSMANRAVEDVTVIQGIWNLRDRFEALGATLVMLGPSIKLPSELSSDAPLFEEAIPTQEQIEEQIDSTIEDAKIPAPDAGDKARIMDSLTGYLSIFAIKQSLALSVTKTGLDLRKLWDLKVAALKSTAGLEISQPQQGFSALAGCAGIKDFMRQLINGRERFRGVFFLDEIEKMLAGMTGDLSGTTQAMVEQFLYWTEAKKVLGVLLLGVPGAGKSWTAACTAGESKVPLLRGSMSTVKGGIVGQSEGNMRTLLKTVDSVTNGRTLMIATCNSLAALTPEIMARFKLGVFFYDYPSDEESAALWTQYRLKYEIDAKEQSPKAANWVGREIESCCHRAWLFNCALAKAAQSVVPVCRANAGKMDELRRSVSGRFLSASTSGIYEFKAESNLPSTGGRKFEVA